MGVHPPITPLSGLSSSLYSHFFNARPLGLSGQVQAAGFFAAIFKTLYCLEGVFSETGLPVFGDSAEKPTDRGQRRTPASPLQSFRALGLSPRTLGTRARSRRQVR